MVKKVKPGKAPEEMTKRNELVVIDYQAGVLTSAQMVRKYGISTTRIYKILKDVTKNRRKNYRQKLAAISSQGK